MKQNGYRVQQRRHVKLYNTCIHGILEWLIEGKVSVLCNPIGIWGFLLWIYNYFRHSMFHLYTHVCFFSLSFFTTQIGQRHGHRGGFDQSGGCWPPAPPDDEDENTQQKNSRRDGQDPNEWCHRGQLLRLPFQQDIPYVLLNFFIGPASEQPGHLSSVYNRGEPRCSLGCCAGCCCWWSDLARGCDNTYSLGRVCSVFRRNSIWDCSKSGGSLLNGWLARWLRNRRCVL